MSPVPNRPPTGGQRRKDGAREAGCGRAVAGRSTAEQRQDAGRHSCCGTVPGARTEMVRETVWVWGAAEGPFSSASSVAR
jgi:hypothetical protein